MLRPTGEKIELAKDARPVQDGEKVGGEVEQLIKSTSSLCAKTHFKNDTEAIQKLNKLRDKPPIVTTKGNQAPTLLAGILRSLAVRKIPITSNALGIEPNELR